MIRVSYLMECAIIVTIASLIAIIMCRDEWLIWLSWIGLVWAIYIDAARISRREP